MFTENYTRALGQTLNGFKLKMILVFGLVMLSSACNMLSDIQRSFSDVEVTATVLDRTSTCVLRTRATNGKNQKRRKMDCEEANRIRTEEPHLNAKVYKRTYVVLSYPLANGTTMSTRVRERKVRARGVPIGGQLRVVYNENKPRSVRSLKSSSKAWSQIWYLIFGGMGLALIFFGRKLIGALWRHLLRTLEEHERMRPKDQPMPEWEQPRPEPTPYESTPYEPPKEQPANYRAKRKRHRTPVPAEKLKPLGSTGGVVSRRRSWFGFAG